MWTHSKIAQIIIILGCTFLMELQSLPAVVPEHIVPIEYGNQQRICEIDKNVYFKAPFDTNTDIYMSQTKWTQKYVISNNSVTYIVRRYPLTSPITSMQFFDMIATSFTPLEPNIRFLADQSMFAQKFGVIGLQIYMFAPKNGQTLYILETPGMIYEDDYDLIYGFVDSMVPTKDYVDEIINTLINEEYPSQRSSKPLNN